MGFFNNKIVLDYERLRQLIQAHRVLGHQTVCTIGSWDILNVGHLRYLHMAHQQGDVLVVGVDSDRAIKIYKNPLRPFIEQDERLEMLTHLDSVTYVTIVDDVDEEGRWQYGLIERVPFDIFVTVTNDSYPPEQLAEIRNRCGALVELPRQADRTSSSGIIRSAMMNHLLALMQTLEKQGGQ